MVFFHRGGAKSVADIATEGPKSLLLKKITILPLLFLSQRGGQTPLPISMGGHGRICPPGFATVVMHINFAVDFSFGLINFVNLSTTFFYSTFFKVFYFFIKTRFLTFFHSWGQCI